MDLLWIPWRVRMGIVASSYVAVFALAGAMIVARYFAGLRDPNTFNGGMGAGGDWILELMIFGLLLFPTFLLALAIRDREAMYTLFSKALLGFSLTAPICLGLLFIPYISQTRNILGFLCMDRLLAAPMVVIGLAVGRWLARYKTAKRLTGWAVAIEAGTIVLMIAFLFFFRKTGIGS
jgi:hypothetical protein